MGKPATFIRHMTEPTTMWHETRIILLVRETYLVGQAGLPHHNGPSSFSDEAVFDSFASGQGGTNAGGIFSRAHDFGSGFEEVSLKTEFKEFDSSNAVPKPSTMLLLGIGLVGLLAGRRKKEQI